MEMPLTELNSKEIKIVIIFLNSKLVHYSDIGKSIGKSRKTITKYLDNIEHVLAEYQVELIRKRNVGMYLKGNTAKLSKDLQISGLNSVPKNKQERVTFILSRLLLSNQKQSIQKLADMTFVSRGTLENDFKEVKRLLAEHNAFIETTNKGVRVIASESSKRELISELLTMYWGNTLYSKSKGGTVNSKLQLPKDITEFFDKDIFAKVTNSLEEFESVSELKFTDYEYQSLAIHLIISLERIINNEILTEGENDQTLEKNTVELVKILEKNFSIAIPKYEKQYINIHILAAEGKPLNDKNIRGKVNNIQQNAISDFLKSNISDYDSQLINGLMIHLTSAMKRLYLGLNLHNPYSEEIKRNFPQAFNEAIDLCAKLEKRFNVSMNKDEVAYVALHFEAYIERPKNMVSAVIVCSSGLGTARLLNQRVKKFFRNIINVKRVTSIQELKHNSIKEDLIISTINLNVPGKTVIIVPPFLDDNSIQRINDSVNEILGKTNKQNAFGRLLQRKLVVLDQSATSRDKVINKLGSVIVNNKYGQDGIAEAAIKREEMASTAIGNVAMPHATINYVNKPFIAIYINPDGIDWKGTVVNIVFFLAMNKEVHDEIDSIYERFNNILENKKLLKDVVNSKNTDQIIKLLSGESNE